MLLITGATGHNGIEIIKQLTAAGVPVRALVREASKAKSITGPGVEIVEGDFDAPETLDAALQGIDRAFLLPPLDPRTVQLVKNFVDAAKRVGTKHIVKFSVDGASLDAPVRFGRWHAEGDQYLEESGIPHTLLQPNMFYQNMLGIAPQIASQGTIYMPAENSKVSQVDVRDIAAVAVKTLTEDGHIGQTYVITGPTAISYTDIAQTLSAALGKPVTYVSISPEQFKTAMLGSGAPEWLADAMNELYAVYRAGYGGGVTDTFAQVTGKPPTTFEQFIQDHLSAFQAK
jgi:uncharacterized protein YbjT (DUF2867 family)